MESLVLPASLQFNAHNQKQGELIVKYIAVLCKTAEYCSYGDSLSEMLRDRLVCGITNTTVQKRLLAEKELSLDKAVYSPVHGNCRTMGKRPPVTWHS